MSQQHSLSAARRMLVAQYHRLANVLATEPPPTGTLRASLGFALGDVEFAIIWLDAALKLDTKAALEPDPGIEPPLKFHEFVEAWFAKRGLAITRQEVLELTAPYEELLERALRAASLRPTIV